MSLTRISFTKKLGFHTELKNRVNEYFTANNISKTGGWRILIKSLFIGALVISSYFSLVFYAQSWLMVLLSAFLLAQGLVLTGFNIMHDSVHGSFSRSRVLNKVLGYTLNLLGGSQRLWYHKHNVLHHTYTNIAGVDTDLESDGLLRLSPNQEWRPWHRLQVFYALPIYSFLTLSMVLVTDYTKFFSNSIGPYKMPKPTFTETSLFFITKLLYFFYALALPMFFHPVLNVLGGFILVHMILGFTMSVVFQLAHTVEENDFPVAQIPENIIENEWAIHQVETTANFSPKSRFANWYMGGLNFQIEHHLFAKISHVHYRKISKIVEETCRDFGIKYTSYSTMLRALWTHIRFLNEMSKKDAMVITASNLVSTGSK
jgi:linoleoyl-CoA desaturase